MNAINVSRANHFKNLFWPDKEQAQRQKRLDDEAKPIKRMWTAKETMELIAEYPVTSNKDLMIKYKCTERVLTRKAEKLGVRKTYEFLAGLNPDSGMIFVDEKKNALIKQASVYIRKNNTIGALACLAEALAL